MDVLTDLLERARARGAGFSHSTVRGPFGLAFPAVSGLAVHAIVEGELQLWTDDATRPERLIGGDLVLVKGGLDHHLATSPERPLRQISPEAELILLRPIQWTATRVKPCVSPSTAASA